MIYIQNKWPMAAHSYKEIFKSGITLMHNKRCRSDEWSRWEIRLFVSEETENKTDENEEANAGEKCR